MNDFNELKKMIINMNDIERLIEGIRFGTPNQLKFPAESPARTIQSRMILAEDYLNKIKELEAKILELENKTEMILTDDGMIEIPSNIDELEAIYKAGDDIRLEKIKEAGDAVGQELAERKFTESDLTSFGKYLLSAQRTKMFRDQYNEEDNISIEERLAEVYDADMKNWYNQETQK